LDGITWTSAISRTANNLAAITFGNGLFVATGFRGTIQTSTDGDVWVTRPTGTTRALRGVAFGGGQFVTVGNLGTIFISDDGITWTNVDSGFSNILYGVTYGSGTFTAVGFPSATTGFSTVLTSPDGLAWTERSAGCVQTLWGVTHGNGTFVAVGEQGAILQSTNSNELRLTANGFVTAGFVLSLTGEVGGRYKLLASTNLTGGNWNELFSFTNLWPAQTLTDTTATVTADRYYRVLSF